MQNAETQEKCPRCAVALVPGMALENTLCGFPDFAGDGPTAGMTLSYSGPARQIACLKCPACGHSRKAGSERIWKAGMDK